MGRGEEQSVSSAASSRDRRRCVQQSTQSRNQVSLRAGWWCWVLGAGAGCWCWCWVLGAGAGALTGLGGFTSDASALAKKGRFFHISRCSRSTRAFRSHFRRGPFCIRSGEPSMEHADEEEEGGLIDDDSLCFRIQEPFLGESYIVTFCIWAINRRILVFSSSCGDIIKWQVVLIWDASR